MRNAHYGIYNSHSGIYIYTDTGKTAKRQVMWALGSVRTWALEMLIGAYTLRHATSDEKMAKRLIVHDANKANEGLISKGCLPIE